MRAAPPCTVVLADGCTERRWIVALHGLAGATLALWAAIWADLLPATTAALVGVGALVTAWLGAGSGTRPLVRYAAAPMALHWSGTVWHLLPGPDAAPDVATVLDAVSPAIDTGPWLLLRARRDDAPDRWLVADARLTPPADWAALRVALTAHGAPPAPRARGAQSAP